MPRQYKASKKEFGYAQSWKNKYFKLTNIFSLNFYESNNLASEFFCSNDFYLVLSSKLLCNIFTLIEF